VREEENGWNELREPLREREQVARTLVDHVRNSHQRAVEDYLREEKLNAPDAVAEQDYHSRQIQQEQAEQK
jgi:predicted small metal-binding protein